MLWVQNSHPCPIPARAVGLNAMGRDDIAWLDREIARWERIYRDHDLASMRDRALYTIEALKTARKHITGNESGNIST